MGLSRLLRVDNNVAVQKANATVGCRNRNRVSQNRQRYLIVIFLGQIDSEIFYWRILRGTLTSWGVYVYRKCAFELKPTSLLTDDFIRNSLSKCVIEFIFFFFLNKKTHFILYFF